MRKLLFFILLILVLVTACSAKKPTGIPSLPDTGTSVQAATQTPQAQPTKAAPAATSEAVQPARMPTATAVPTQASIEYSAEVAENGLNLRVGPGLNHRVLGVLQAGQKVRVEGRSVTGEWIAVQLPDGREGWVYAAYLKNQPNLAALPVLEAYGGPETAANPAVNPAVNPAASPTAKPTTVPSRRYTFAMAIDGGQAEVRLGNFPADSEFTLQLSARGEAKSMTIATVKTGTDGSAVSTFEMPRTWADGSSISQHDLVLTASNSDGSLHRSISIAYDSGE